MLLQSIKLHTKGQSAPLLGPPQQSYVVRVDNYRVFAPILRKLLLRKGAMRLIGLKANSRAIYIFRVVIERECVDLTVK
jgi:hypothetical protein